MGEQSGCVRVVVGSGAGCEHLKGSKAVVRALSQGTDGMRGPGSPACLLARAREAGMDVRQSTGAKWETQGRHVAPNVRQQNHPGLVQAPYDARLFKPRTMLACSSPVRCLLVGK
eukprot:364402-Chlamydomonas_euryale.AAC.6